MDEIEEKKMEGNKLGIKKRKHFTKREGCLDENVTGKTNLNDK